MPIRIRLTVAFAAATLVLFSVIGFLFLRSFRHGLETSLDPGLRTQAVGLVQALRTDGERLDLRPNGSRVETRDVVAQVLDREGRVVTATREAGNVPVIRPSIVRRARDGSVFAQVRVGREHEPYRVLARPATGAGPRIVVVATSLEATENAVGRVRDALLVGGAIAVVLAGTGAWFLAAAALRPVERMRREAAEISEHDRTVRLRVPATRDEIAALGATMNDLLARLQAALARQRSFVADAGHELRTPLAILGTELELARRPQRSREDLQESIRHAAIETGRLQRLADELLLLARSDEGDDRTSFVPVPVARVIERAFDAFRARADERGVRLCLTADPAVRAPIDTQLLRRALDNLIDNALRYSPRGSTIEARVHVDGDDVLIDVLDEGPGFPEEFLPHAFERFRRGDDARTRADGGTGLGLAIVRAAGRTHGGTATAANRAEGGAVVTVRIPAKRRTERGAEM